MEETQLKLARISPYHVPIKPKLDFWHAQCTWYYYFGAKQCCIYTNTVRHEYVDTQNLKKSNMLT